MIPQPSDQDSLDRVSDEDARSEWLLIRLCEGDCAFLGELYDRYCRLVYSIAYRVLQDQGEAEDMVQDVFLTIYRNAHTKMTGKGTVRGWIVSIAYHGSLDRWRYLCTRRFYKENGLDALHGLEAGLAPDYAEILNIQRRIQAAMAMLLPRQEKTLRLYFYEGYSLREIAEEIGESFRNVRNHFYRGIARLRTAIIVEQEDDQSLTSLHSHHGSRANDQLKEERI